MFDEHMSMLKEKMAKKAARQEQMRLEREAKRKVLTAVCCVFLLLCRSTQGRRGSHMSHVAC